MHWNGSNWDTVTGDFVQCWDCIINTGAVSAEAGEGWAMGGYYAMRWDGIQWGQVDVPWGWWLSAVSILAKNDSWAAGAKGDQPFYGLAIHWDGQEWMETSMPPGAPRLYALKMISSRDGWVMGDYGMMYHWDGIAWRLANQVVTSKIVDIASSPDGKLWAITEDGVLLRLVENK